MLNLDAYTRFLVFLTEYDKEMKEGVKQDHIARLGLRVTRGPGDICKYRRFYSSGYFTITQDPELIFVPHKILRRKLC